MRASNEQAARNQEQLAQRQLDAAERSDAFQQQTTGQFMAAYEAQSIAMKAMAELVRTAQVDQLAAMTARTADDKVPARPAPFHARPGVYFPVPEPHTTPRPTSTPAKMSTYKPPNLPVFKENGPTTADTLIQNVVSRAKMYDGSAATRTLLFMGALDGPVMGWANQYLEDKAADTGDVDHEQCDVLVEAFYDRYIGDVTTREGMYHGLAQEGDVKRGYERADDFLARVQRAARLANRHHDENSVIRKAISAFKDPELRSIAAEHTRAASWDVFKTAIVEVSNAVRRQPAAKINGVGDADPNDPHDWDAAAAIMAVHGARGTSRPWKAQTAAPPNCRTYKAFQRFQSLNDLAAAPAGPANDGTRAAGEGTTTASDNANPANPVFLADRT